MVLLPICRRGSRDPHRDQMCEQVSHLSQKISILLPGAEVILTCTLSIYIQYTKQAFKVLSAAICSIFGVYDLFIVKILEEIELQKNL